MKNKKQIILAPLILALPLMGPSCSSSNDGGIYKTTDNGENWKQIVAIEDNKETLVKTDTDQIIPDPSNPDVVFAVTKDKGLFMSNQFGETWKRLIPETKDVYFIEPDAKQDGRFYVSALMNGRGKILFTENSGTDWKEIYTETGKNTYITQVRVDPFNQSAVLAVNSDGLLMKSTENSQNWQPTFPFQEKLINIAFDPAEKDSIWALSDKGVWHSRDGGYSFDLLELGGVLSEMGNQYYLLEKNIAGLFLATEKGFYRSRDDGKVWEKIITLNNPADYPPNFFQLFPDGIGRKWALGAGMTLYITEDEGTNWKPIQLEIDRYVNALAIKPDDAGQMLVGVKAPKKNMLIQ